MKGEDQAPAPVVDGGAGAYGGSLDGTGMRIGIVTSRFNAQVTDRLLAGCVQRLAQLGVDDGDVVTVWVPGAFELAVAASWLAASGAYGAVICLGAVIRGETDHYELVARTSADGIARVALDTGVPVIYEVLACETEELALVRAGVGPGARNKGASAAEAAVWMAGLAAQLRDAGSVEALETGPVHGVGPAHGAGPAYGAGPGPVHGAGY